MLRHSICAAMSAALLLSTTAAGDSDQEIFEAGDHCVAYRTIKDMFFGVDVEVIGRSCEVTAELTTEAAENGPRVVVRVPARSFRSGNVLRNKAVADLLGAETQPELIFTSSPIDPSALRGEIAEQLLSVPGQLQLGGRSYPVDFPLEIVEHAGRHYVKGRLVTTFEAFEVEVPTIALGLIAKPHEELELSVQLELEQVTGLVEWVDSVGLR